MKNEIDKLQEIDKIKNENKISYFEGNWKEHPYNKFFKLWKPKSWFVQVKK
jgi:hypothetical protein